MNIALAGNPNTGKTSLFNILTDSYEYVGNWAGVTVEKKMGVLKNNLGTLVDLPGIYSLNPLSKDEGVATNYLLNEDVSIILNIVDASQLKRNLYLTLQLLEYGNPLLICLNMVDVAESLGLQINHEKLAKKLACPVIPIVARTGEGCENLINEIPDLANKKTTPFRVNYGDILEEAIEKLIDLLPSEMDLPKRWLAIQFFEGNTPVRHTLAKYIDGKELDTLYKETEAKLASKAKSLPQYIHLRRGQWIEQIIQDCVIQTKQVEKTITERIDQVVANKYLGIPIFLALMYFTFKLTFEWVGTPLSDLLGEWIEGPVSEGVTSLLQALGASKFMQDLIVDGIIAGVGGVIVFVPQIFMLFLLISFIEDSGYMARITVVMDKLMEHVGLNGKAFIPMIIGFGCNVPGIMAARTIEQPKERLLTIILTPLMSCSARLTVYALFVSTFFKKNQAIIILSLYVLGIVVALILAKIFSTTIARHEESIFVVELPPYRTPQWRSLLRSTWEKGKGFVRKAGTFILAGSVLIWLLGYMGPGGFGVKMEQSFLALIGGFIGSLLTPLGFGTWQAGASLITGFLAKEVVVSTMNIIYAVQDEAALQGILPQFFTPLQAYSFMAFILLYTPCLATVAVIKKETASAKWTWFSVLYAFFVAYLISFIIFQGGKLLGFH
ncbi:ferrous iron transport protein B [Thermoflavimicrobium dichotomicum]|uniref:Ferrous iron transport protein B n=1 Tax=Thermoflavimicrobium dichotomicum TaxID=46223 RepID=A0A1I3U4Y6_9BACL|nr:ferrous iron transport protein B [Thermoflavimicrobium dichotomicum]SFJ76851.1 ferrous iron transport protein B [Thermoflavimicrobium dichotomicum]